MDVETISTEVVGGLVGALMIGFVGALLSRFGRATVWIVLSVTIVASLVLGLVAYQTRDNGYTILAAGVFVGGVIACATILLRTGAGRTGGTD